MPLTIYRRHTEKCPYYGKPRNARNNRACQRRCPIYVQGSLGGEYVRMSLDLTYWEPAAELVASWEKAGRIERAQCPAQARGTSTPQAAARIAPRLQPASQPEASPLAEDPTTIPIPGAIARFRASLKSQNLSWETLGKYRTLLTRLANWCEHESLIMVSELSVTRMDDFRGTWKDGPNYATKNLERLRAFFEFCVARDWIDRNSAKAVKAPQVDVLPTLPFTDEEMARIVAACDRVRGKDNQDRMRAFVLTMRYSGLRISDMVALHPAQRVGTKLRLYTTKTGVPVFVPLPDFVNDALDKIQRPGHPYFTTGNGKLTTHATNWSGKLQSLFELAEVENGRSHRFRDTFSCSLLEQGVSDVTVAMLLGNTPAIVQKHYAPWIKSRQVALEAAVRTTWQSPSAIDQANGLDHPAGVPDERRVAVQVSAAAPHDVETRVDTPLVATAPASFKEQDTGSREAELFRSRIPRITDAWINQSPSKHTRSAYRKDMKAFISFLQIEWPLDAAAVLRVQLADVLRYCDELTNGSAPRSYVLRRLKVISSWYQFLAAAAAQMGAGIVVHNPAEPQLVQRWDGGFALGGVEGAAALGDVAALSEIGADEAAAV
ncbi:MAG: tyrosine-type recombinase/integrase [Luteitalea sp.]|nr:tyrosine-type recombinase/integrase [Luteitalea sp.]